MTDSMEGPALASIPRISYKNWAILFAVPVVFSFPVLVHSKDIWLQCGEQQLLLDDEKETVAMEVDGMAVKSSASFFPKQINFEIKTNPPQGSRFSQYARDLWVIDRSNLSFSKTPQTGHAIFRGSISWMSDAYGGLIGTCKLIPSPARKNLI